MEVSLVCEECSRDYSVRPYRSMLSRFCSFECSGRFRARETLNVGPKPHLIGNKFRVGKRPTNAFEPGRVGSASPSWKEGIKRTCENCGNGFCQKEWLARQNGLARFCGRDCFIASGIFRSERSPCYVGGITTYRGKGWLKIRAKVVAEQAGDCKHCGKHVGAAMPVHHIVPFRLFSSADEANARGNLVGLCQSCHMKAERSA